MTPLYEIVIMRTSPHKIWCGDEYLGFSLTQENASAFAAAEKKRIMQDPLWRQFYDADRYDDTPAVKVRLCHASLVEDIKAGENE